MHTCLMAMCSWRHLTLAVAPHPTPTAVATANHVGCCQGVVAVACGIAHTTRGRGRTIEHRIGRVWGTHCAHCTNNHPEDQHNKSFRSVTCGDAITSLHRATWLAQRPSVAAKPCALYCSNLEPLQLAPVLDHSTPFSTSEV